MALPCGPVLHIVSTTCGFLARPAPRNIDELSRNGKPSQEAVSRRLLSSQKIAMEFSRVEENKSNESKE